MMLHKRGVWNTPATRRLSVWEDRSINGRTVRPEQQHGRRGHIHRVRIISIKEPTDASPAGQFMEGVIEEVDAFYSANLSGGSPWAAQGR